MPELPEVETIRKQLHKRLAGAKIVKVELLRSGRERPLGEAFVKALRGKIIERVDRRAKLLIWKLSDGNAVLAHLKMTGRFTFVEKNEEPGPHASLRFTCKTKTGETLYCVWSDMRKFGFMEVVTKAVLAERLSAYGPEPLDTSAKDLANCLRKPATRTIKSALLDQSCMAGVGNIYADEACFRAKILPSRRLGSLTSKDRLRLAEGVKTVLEESLALHGTSAHTYVDTEGSKGGFLSFLQVYGRRGESCRKCDTPIKKVKQAQRGTHFCPNCQR